ncbi:SRP9 domain-containing protein [[Candida] zeylanoides]
MPTETTLDRFIETSSSLLSAYPTTATLSVTYSNSAKKNKRVPVKDGELKRATNKVTFKCYEARSGKCTKYSTHKAKELSRLLTFAGPRGVSVTKTSSDRPADNLQDAATATTHKAGLASIMSNVKYEEDSVAAPKADTSATAEVETKGAAASAADVAASTSKSKKKKKKGKK